MTEATTGHPMPRIGDTAPNFNAASTTGPIEFHRAKSQKWALLFSHPADFTPVCSTELSEFARRSSEFEQRNTALFGLSIDSIHSHLAWVENLKTVTGVSLEYPLIADSTREVASLYGMIHPGESSTVTVRALFFIDPAHVIRAIIYYPLNVGRNIDEVLRTLDALQFSDQQKLACPANWTPGEKAIVPPPKTIGEVADRRGLADKDEFLDFYLIKREA